MSKPTLQIHYQLERVIPTRGEGRRGGTYITDTLPTKRVIPTRGEGRRGGTYITELRSTSRTPLKNQHP